MSGRTPYLDALRDFAGRAPARFTVPGHKGGDALPGPLVGPLGRAATIDVPLLIDGVDVEGAAGAVSPLEEAQQLAAQAWGASRTWFLTGGATQANLAACLAVAPHGRRVVVQRSSHSSTFNGLALAGLDPTYALPHVDPALAIAHCIDPSTLDRALTRTPGAGAVFVVSPTYYGSTADVAGLGAVAHAHGALLVVDEAWGAHLRFSDRLPQDALSAGADLVVSSTHKHLGSLGGSAMLHRSPTAPGWVDGAIDRALGLLTSTSPSSLLMASLDAARARAATHGSALLDAAIDELATVRAAVRELPGLGVLDEHVVGRFGVAGLDPLRLCIDVRGTGRTGVSIAAELSARDGVELELAGERVMVALFGLGESPATGAERLLAALRRIVGVRAGAGKVGELGGSGAVADADLSSGRGRRDIAWASAPTAAPVLRPREALWAERRRVPIEEAHGRVAAEAIVPYPPGIPVLLPGERIDRALLERVRDAVRGGATLRGASDPTLHHVAVVADPVTPALVAGQSLTGVTA